MAELEAEGVGCLVVVASNSRLEVRVRRPLGRARMQAEATGRTATLSGDTRHAARRWSHKRRVIMKAEGVHLGDRAARDSPRFVGAIRRHPAAHLSGLYRDRGALQNRFEEPHGGLGLDRRKCSPFRASACADSQVGGRGERVDKLGARVSVSARRNAIHPRIAPLWPGAWQAVALAVAAPAG